MHNGIYQTLCTVRARRGGCFLLLIDPDKIASREYLMLTESAESCGVDAILVGTSFMLKSDFDGAVLSIKKSTSLPVIIFPGSYTQITPHADAILFTSLISCRNPHYLIEEQVKGAPFVKAANIESIPTGYMLIESGNLTSVQFISGSLPIPRSKPDIACAHALAAQYLGMKLVYLEAGSGADQPVPVEMVRAVAGYIDIPVMVGGGLRTPDDCARRIDAGASFVIMGNHLETDGDLSLLRDLTAATHPRESVAV